MLVNNGGIRNYILLVVIKRMGLFYRQKENSYPLVTILGDPILYKDDMIHFETKPFKIMVKK